MWPTAVDCMNVVVHLGADRVGATSTFASPSAGTNSAGDSSLFDGVIWPEWRRSFYTSSDGSTSEGSGQVLYKTEDIFEV